MTAILDRRTHFGDETAVWGLGLFVYADEKTLDPVLPSNPSLIPVREDIPADCCLAYAFAKGNLLE